ncbi:MAG: hypothetical protein ACQETI_06460 [Halobacteriota archaeon]
MTAGLHVGADYVERRNVGGDTHPVGEMDEFSAYAREGFDTAAVHPEVRRFYERTSEYELTYRVRWHRGFRLGAAAASRLTSRIEQLNLPGPGEEGKRSLRSRFVDIDPAADPRNEARAWIRTDPQTGEAVFVAVYANHRHDGERFVNIAVPLPWSNLSTVLRIEPFPTHHGTGARLTTCGAGDPGLYLRTPRGGFSLPMAQTFRVWPAETGDRPSLRGNHEMWVYGWQFLTIDYEIRRATE